MSDSIETSEDMAMPFSGALPGMDGEVDPITRAVQLLREVAVEYARSVSIGDVPDWENEPETKAAHDEALLIARHLEAMAPAPTEPSKAERADAPFLQEIEACRADPGPLGTPAYIGPPASAAPSKPEQGDGASEAREEIEAVIACLGDDAAQLRDENPEDERADNMDKAADLLGRLLATTPPASAAGERDVWLGGSNYEASMLRNLLARIHGDGGHYLERNGLEKTMEDADQLVSNWRAALASQPVSEQVAQDKIDAEKATSSLPGVVDAVEFRREAYGLSCRQWSAVLGMEQSHYSEFVNRKRELPKAAMALAFEFGVPADALFQRRPDKGGADIDRRLAELERLRGARTRGEAIASKPQDEQVPHA